MTRKLEKFKSLQISDSQIRSPIINKLNYFRFLSILMSSKSVSGVIFVSNLLYNCAPIQKSKETESRHDLEDDVLPFVANYTKYL